MLRRYSPSATEPWPSVPRWIASSSPRWQPAFNRARTRYRIPQRVSVRPRRPEHEHHSFAPAEGREETQKLFPRKILLVEQLHTAGRLFTVHDLRARFNPI